MVDLVDPQYAKHWTKYAEDYLQELKKHRFDQDSKKLMAWVKKFKTHDKDFAFHEKMSQIICSTEVKAGHFLKGNFTFSIGQKIRGYI